MSAVLSWDGFIAALTRIDLWYTSAAVEIGLFKTNVSIDNDTVFTDLTEADFSGYARQVLPNFSGATQVPAGASAETTEVTFEHDAGATTNTIYGYFVVNPSGDVLLFAEEAPSPSIMEFDGDQIIIKVYALMRD